MHLDVGFRNRNFLDQEGCNLLTLISLQLDDLSHLLVLHERAVACEFFLERFDQLLAIILCAGRREREQCEVSMCATAV